MKTVIWCTTLGRYCTYLNFKLLYTNSLVLNWLNGVYFEFYLPQTTFFFPYIFFCSLKQSMCFPTNEHFFLWSLSRFLSQGCLLLPVACCSAFCWDQSSLLGLSTLFHLYLCWTGWLVFDKQLFWSFQVITLDRCSPVVLPPVCIRQSCSVLKD